MCVVKKELVKRSVMYIDVTRTNTLSNAFCAGPTAPVPTGGHPVTYTASEARLYRHAAAGQAAEPLNPSTLVKIT